MRRALLTICVFGLLATAACTGFKVDPELSYACATDDDCAAQPGRVCLEGHCRLPGPADAGEDAGCTPRTCEDLGRSCGEADDGCGGTLMCGGCDAGQGCGAVTGAGACEACQATDAPDDGFIDANCDGIDGQLDAGIFVDDFTGDDSNPGTADQPVKSLQAGATLAAASGLPVLVSTGTYDGLALSSKKPVSIHGGYDRAKGWSRSDMNAVSIETPPTGAQLVDISAPVVLDRLRIQSADAQAPGGASVALLVDSVQQLELRHVELRAGAGAAGSGGMGGQAGADGGPGSSPESITYDLGGAGGLSDCGAPGGAGGAGGLNGDAGTPGETPADGGVGGDGGVGYACGSSGVAGPGGPGGPGADGTMGPSGGAGRSFGSWTFDQYLTADGEPGGTGNPGAGGGGGGGGGGSVTCALFDFPGGGGGGGGAGGCGGAGGSGGQGGGASVALRLSNSVATLTDTSLVTKGGGTGGPGASGGEGGRGGPGAGGTQISAPSSAGNGGKGADGAAGGEGGPGGGGGGGPSIGIWCTNSQVTGSYTDALGNPGEGGKGPGEAGAEGLRQQTLDCN